MIRRDTVLLSDWSSSCNVAPSYGQSGRRERPAKVRNKSVLVIYFRNSTNLYPGIVSVNMLCLPREHRQDVHGRSELTSPAERPFHGFCAGHPSPSEIQL